MDAKLELPSGKVMVFISSPRVFYCLYVDLSSSQYLNLSYHASDSYEILFLTTLRHQTFPPHMSSDGSYPAL